MNNYLEILTGIKPLRQEVMAEAWRRLDSLIKPIGSLGRLEEIAAQISGITGRVRNEIAKKCIVVMAADNGVCAEGVSSCPKEITAIQTLNFVRGIAGVNVLAGVAGAELRIVDIGIDAELANPGIIDCKIRRGTSNMAQGPAMSRAEAVRGIEAGIAIVAQLADEGYNLLGTGEMGAGNTSTSSAILMAFTGCDAETAVGKGAGLTDPDFAKKKAVITTALIVNQPDRNDPLDVLAKVGGFDIAGLVGCYLGAAYYRIPIVIDGFIAAAAALTAVRLNPLVKDYLIASHASAEPGFRRLMQELGMEAAFNLQMRLGEGTGCALGFQVIEAALAVMNRMGTFAEMNMANDFLVDIR